MSKEEIEVLKLFIREFNPIYSEDMLNRATYRELFIAAKETADNL
jgi:hypothetical protein